jgi:hypothetical protein
MSKPGLYATVTAAKLGDNGVTVTITGDDATLAFEFTIVVPKEQAHRYGVGGRVFLECKPVRK